MDTVSLEWAKKLKECGWEQRKCLRAYLEGVIVDTLTFGGLTHEQMPKDPVFFDAPSIGELLGALPEGFEYPLQVIHTNLGKRRIFLGMRSLRNGVPFG